MDNKEGYKGKFFLPSMEDQKIDGELIIKDDGEINIKLFGIIRAEDNSSSFQFINGVVEKLGLITCYNSFERSSTRSSRGISHSLIYTNLLLIGTHFKEKEELKFKALTGRIQYLEDWSNAGSNLDLNGGLNQIHYEGDYKVNFSYQEMTFEIFNEKEIKNKIHFMGFEIKSYFSIFYSKEHDIFTLLEDYLHFLNFITFLIQSPSKRLMLTMTNKDNKPISVIYKTRNNVDSKANLFKDDFLFDLKEFDSKIKDVLTRWYDLSNSHNHILSSYFASFVSKQTGLDDKFLHISRALESIHREKIRKKSDYIDRVEEIFHKVKSCFENILIIKDEKKFFKEVKDLRNDLTHNNYNVSKMLETQKLHYLTISLRVIVTSFILSNLGFENEQIKGFFEHYKPFKYLMGKQEY